MKLLAITHRFGPDLIGGAEWHLYRLLSELVRMGVDVTVATTNARELEEIGTYAAIWKPGYPTGLEMIDGIKVHRYKSENPWRWRMLRGASVVQREMVVKDWTSWDWDPPVDLEEGQALLGRGWYFPERSGGTAHRWSGGTSEILLKVPGAKAIKFTTLGYKSCKVYLSDPDEDFGQFASFSLGRSIGSFEIPLPDSVTRRIYFEFSKRGRPWSDSRFLSADFYSVAIVGPNGEEIPIDLSDDWKEHRTDVSFEQARWYHEHGQPCLLQSDKTFRWVRGPRSRALEKKALELAADVDVILGHCMPQATVDLARRIGKKAGKPVLQMPLAHLEDSFYHWPFFYEAIQKADLVLALSRFAEKAYGEIFDGKAKWIGSGVAPDEFEGLEEDIAKFREKHNPEGLPTAIFVGRKSGAKKYGVFIKAVEQAVAKMPCKGWMIGPEDDGVPVDSDAVEYFGALPRREVLAAIGAADVLVLPSESESFGIVFAEAWMLGKPVLGARRCGAVASLIDDGQDGYLCGPQEEWTDRLIELFNNPEMANSMGQRGREKALAELTWTKAAERLHEGIREVLNHE